MSGFVCYNCGWWTDINGVSICGYSGRPTVRHDSCEAWKTTVETNADRTRAMTDEELAKTVVKTYGVGGVCPPNHTHLFCVLDNGCGKCWLYWLKSPVEVDNG